MSSTDLIEIREIESVNRLLSAAQSDDIPASAHFSADEQFFLKTTRPLRVPRFPVHHDVRNPVPTVEYLKSLEPALTELIERFPGLFRACRYSFDPAYPHEAVFYRVLSRDGTAFVYLLRVSLAFAPRMHTVLEKGNNDYTASYCTNRLPVEALIMPVARVDSNSIRVERYISSTWIGETGRGYLTQGIWVDRDFSKILSRIVNPNSAKTYPWFPVGARYNTISYRPIELSPPSIDALTTHVTAIRYSLASCMSEIEALLRSGDRETLSGYVDSLVSSFPDGERERYRGIRTRAYLNEFDQKEYQIERETV